MTSDQPAWELTWDTSHLGDDPSDADLVKFPGSAYVFGWMDTAPVTVPDRIFFEANRRSLAKIDYPFNNVAWPIMSRRMLETLLKVGDFRHRAVPLLMLDDTVPTKKRLDEAGNPRPGVADDGFVAVQLLDHADVLDWERSQVQPDPKMPGTALSIAQPVLKVPAGGLPPLFRLSAKPRVLFVSDAGRRALEEAGIRGVKFRPLDKVRV